MGGCRSPAVNLQTCWQPCAGSRARASSKAPEGPYNRLARYLATLLPRARLGSGPTRVCVARSPDPWSRIMAPQSNPRGLANCSGRSSAMKANPCRNWPCSWAHTSSCALPGFGQRRDLVRQGRFFWSQGNTNSCSQNHLAACHCVISVIALSRLATCWPKAVGLLFVRPEISSSHLGSAVY